LPSLGSSACRLRRLLKALPGVHLVEWDLWYSLSLLGSTDQRVADVHVGSFLRKVADQRRGQLHHSVVQHRRHGALLAWRQIELEMAVALVHRKVNPHRLRRPAMVTWDLILASLASSSWKVLSGHFSQIEKKQHQIYQQVFRHYSIPMQNCVDFLFCHCRGSWTSILGMTGSIPWYLIC